MELQNNSSWKGLKADLIPPCAVGWDTFHYIRLLQAPSNMALNTFRDGADTTLGNLFPAGRLRQSSPFNLVSFLFYAQGFVLLCHHTLRLSKSCSSPEQGVKCELDMSQSLLQVTSERRRENA